MWTITERPEAVPVVLAALSAVAQADGEPSPDQRALLDELARRHRAAPPDPEQAPASIEAVIDALPDDDERRRLVRHLVLMALADARLGGTELERARRWAARSLVGRGARGDPRRWNGVCHACRSVHQRRSIPCLPPRADSVIGS